MVKSVIVDRAFEGYPEGPDAPGRRFAVTGKPIELDTSFADMIVGKGLAHIAEPVVPAASEIPEIIIVEPKPGDA